MIWTSPFESPFWPVVSEKCRHGLVRKTWRAEVRRASEGGLATRRTLESSPLGGRAFIPPSVRPALWETGWQPAPDGLSRVFLAGAPAWIGMKTGDCTSIGGPPGPRPTPSSACWHRAGIRFNGRLRVQGDPRGPGGAPHYVCVVARFHANPCRRTGQE